jgi:hypothetical protein
VVVASIVQSAADFYDRLGVPRDQIKVVSDLPAGHAFVTEEKGIACGRTGEPYITDCDYDQAGAVLRHIYGSLRRRAAEPAGEFLVFDQREFTRDLPSHGMDDAGVVYISRACRMFTACRVHIVFHGCNQHRGKVGDAFVTDTGYARWADTNRLVLLFPQAAPGTVNPQACWDWWGYTGREYLTRAGPQITAVRRMLDRLARKSEPGRV